MDDDTPVALGLIRFRSELKTTTRWDEARIHRLATRLGYTLGHPIFVFGPEPSLWESDITDAIRRYRAEALFVPSLMHLDYAFRALEQLVDVITLDPFHVYARWPLKNLETFE
ncbi:hypothetical protein GV794_08890 [Nocardia cyriacigeorgica]|uniref:Uncharacterized protein n=1 Tax=Nocardia cyriacigeorgica TaxID=135487 RepID=A0A6P1D568_9NOCA|nr:hypothetical protein [Nocardia cyriacigeorgica]NEW41462.1 hypothetical protein [Nocardia cyriacigeorgica]NEW45766.1 hypothetical protein [Nocardia cyriacigeorgica]NEW51974.1 hypothetical protein [Nocardia cyriacigeorgica]NEW55767.1 hypothetical protein [Nocardia cyriacigeorgica]